MSLADRKADEITRREEQDDLRLRFRVRSAVVSDTAAPSMWDKLVVAIQDEVQKFVGRTPKAKSLRADLLNSNNLTVVTTEIPIHSLVLLRTAVGVQATLSPFPSPMKRSCERNLPPIFFSTDPDFRPCFNNGDREISLDMAVDHLLGPMLDLF
jgi:hypothetical protein